MKRDFIAIESLSTDELHALLDRAAKMKADRRRRGHRLESSSESSYRRRTPTRTPPRQPAPRRARGGASTLTLKAPSE